MLFRLRSDGPLHGALRCWASSRLYSLRLSGGSVQLLGSKHLWKSFHIRSYSQNIYHVANPVGKPLARTLCSGQSNTSNFFSSSVPRREMANWSHLPCEGCLAVGEWGKAFEAANGKRQSPIDLTGAEHDEKLAKKLLETKYKNALKSALVNTGHSVQVNFSAGIGGVSGGPLTDQFEILQYHFHWGSCDKQGSEHLVDGRSYPIELHLVHWNKTFKTVEEAVKQPNGLAVLGIFLKVGEENVELKKITDLFDKIAYKSQSVDVEEAICLKGLLPKDTKSYWTYPGSLTTPPCYESVNWIVFRDVITLSAEQLTKFRSVHETGVDTDPAEHRCLVDNYRPVLPINDRKLRCTFKQ